MNQILVTQKLYITPELKKKKRAYKMSFIACIMVIILLIGMYTYANYDRMKNEELSGTILADIDFQEADEAEIETEDVTTIDENENALIVAITKEQAIEETVNSNVEIKEEEKKNIISGQYKASNGKIYSIIGIINIPKINVRYPIISETSDALLKVSACKFWGPNANEIGNLCVVGHNYKNSKFFSKVPTLTIGDIVTITDLNGVTVEYEVYDMYTVDPADTKCTSQLTQGKREVTVITCTDDTKQRVVVKCTEKV